MLIYRSIDTIWIAMTPLAGVGLCCVLIAKKYTLKRNVVHAGEQQKMTDTSGSADNKMSEKSSTDETDKFGDVENDVGKELK